MTNLKTFALAVATLLTAATAQDPPPPPPPSATAESTPQPMLTPAYASCGDFFMAQPWDSNCADIGEYTGITKEEFFKLNPALDVEDGHMCELVPGMWYCIADKADVPAEDEAEDEPEEEEAEEEPAEEEEA